MMIHRALEELSRHLPRIAEEGIDVETIDELALIQKLADSAGGEAHAQTFVLTARRVFQALGLLDAHLLAEGTWRMTSFPALIYARSLLAGLGIDGWRLLDDGFWGDSDYLIERQRSVLRAAEQRRIAASDSPCPIRKVSVSWAAMSLDARFLLVRREDPDQNRVGSRGQFVMPGGRVSSSDLQNLRMSDRLDFFDPFAKALEPSIAKQAFEHALRRELHEELDLTAAGFVSISPFLDAIEYTDLEGAKSAHALTSYAIQLFRVELTPEGKSTLLRCLARNPDRFAWFTFDELIAGVNAKGETSFVNALVAELPENLADMLVVADYDLSIGDKSPITEMIDIPSSAEEVLLIGDTGHERATIHGLDEQALGLLGFLASARRGDPVTSLLKGVSVAGETGWVLIDDSRHVATLKGIATSLNSLLRDSHLLAFHEGAVRLNTLHGMQVNFSPSTFAIGIMDEQMGKSYRLRIQRRPIKCALGTAEMVERSTRVRAKLGAAVDGLMHGITYLTDKDMDTVKRDQRGEMRDFLDAIGMRLLVRQLDGKPVLAALSIIQTPETHANEP